MSVDARIREGLTMIERELPTVDTVEGFENLERDIRRDTRRRRALIGAAAAAVLIAAGGAVVLNRDSEKDVQPAPEPPHPERIVMYDVETGGIAYLNEDGSLETLPMKNVDRFAPSPDGQQIAYITYDESTEKRSLWIADADGSNPEQVRAVRCGGCEPGYGVTWSHDGAYLAYSAWQRGKKPAQLRIRLLAAGQEQVLTMPSTVDPRAPMFSPDDQSLAVNAATDAGQYVATVVPEQGMASWTRLSSSFNQVQAPSWSEDGETIYFTATTSGDNTNDVSASIDLYAVGADGSDQRQITHATPGERYFAVSQDDDRFLISRAQGDAPWEVGWLSADGTTFTPMTDQDGNPIVGNGATRLP